MKKAATKVITFTNIRGGCTKTTNSMHIGVAAALKGRKVLLVDLDPQAHATRGLTRDLTGHEGGFVDQAILGEKARIVDTVFENLKLLPSRIDTNMILGSKPFQQASWPTLLERALAEVKDAFDLVIVDTPATYSQLHTLAFVASDYYIICLRPEAYSFLGFRDSQEQIMATKRDLLELIRPGKRSISEEEVWRAKPQFLAFIMSAVNQGKRIGVREMKESLNGDENRVIEIPESSMFDNVRWKDTPSHTIFDVPGTSRLQESYFDAWKHLETWMKR